MTEPSAEARRKRRPVAPWRLPRLHVAPRAPVWCIVQKNRLDMGDPLAVSKPSPQGDPEEVKEEGIRECDRVIGVGLAQS